MTNATDSSGSNPDSPSLAAPGMPPAGMIENRVAVRRNVTWKARVMLAPNQILEAKTADISSSGVGLICHQPLTQHSLVQLALQVPHLAIAGSFTVITGRAKVAFQVMRGGEYRIGAQWVDLPDSARTLLISWVERLPGKPLE